MRNHKHMTTYVCLFSIIQGMCVTALPMFCSYVDRGETALQTLELEKHACKCVQLIQLFCRPARVIASFNDTHLSML